MHIDEIATPALLVDEAILQANIATLMGKLRSTSVRVRPHLKTAKNVEIARMLLEAGAQGCCVATLDEAEALAAGGIDDLLITSEIADAPKLARLAALHQRHPKVAIVVDSIEGARLLAAACAGCDVPLRVLIELNVGQNRCGVAPGAPALELAQNIATLPSLQLVGLQGYEGHLQHVAESSERERRVDAAMEQLTATAALLREAGFTLEWVTTGGTGTCERCAQHEGVSEVQPGSFVFFDGAYRNALGDATGYTQALVVLATVISRPDAHRAVTDAGLKALSNDMGNAAPFDLPGVRYRHGGDEHGILEWDHEEGQRLAVGDRVMIVPSHIDTTVNLHAAYHVRHGDTITAIWPIISRRTLRALDTAS